MNKEQLLSELSDKITAGEITYDEMMNRFNLMTVKKEIPTQPPPKNSSNFSITKLLYALGSIIAIIGIVLFTYQIWNDIGSLGRVAVTLGLGIITAGVGSLFLRGNGENTIGIVFHFIGGMLIPGGALVTLYEFSNGQMPQWPLAITFGLIFVFYLLINSVHKNVILTLFTVANGTSFIYLLVKAITDGLLNNYVNLYAYLTIVIGICYLLLAFSFKNSWNSRLVPALYLFGILGIEIAAITQYANSFDYQNSIWPVVLSLVVIVVFYLYINFTLKSAKLTMLTILNGTAFVYAFVYGIIGPANNLQMDIYIYLTMVMGAVYLLLAHSFKNTWNAKLVEILNLIGIIGVLGSAFSEIYDSLPWQLFFFLLVSGGFALSIFLRSLIILIVSTISLLAFVSYITSEYFADSVGWPISLVALGFIFIALGYLSITINKKYIKNS